MKKYYILENDIRKGPFSIEELRKKNITEETQICTSEFGWDDAITFSELAPLFNNETANRNTYEYKYYLEENGIKRGPFSVEDLKLKNITEDTQICTDEFEWDDAITFSEVAPLFKKEPVKIAGYKEGTIFGYTLANNNARRMLRIKNILPGFLFAAILLSFSYFIDVHDTFFMIFLLLFILIFHFASTIYLIIKKSQPSVFSGSLKIITADKGEFINNVAQKSFGKAFQIAILYSIIPSSGYLWGKNMQSLNEEVAGVYLVKA